MSAGGEAPIWEPSPDRASSSGIASFARFLTGGSAGPPAGSGAGPPLGLPTTAEDWRSTYEQLWRWSVGSPGAFWEEISKYCRVIWHSAYAEPLQAAPSGGAAMARARWFDGGTLNYAEHALRGAGPAGTPGSDGEEPAGAGTAVSYYTEEGLGGELGWPELRRQVSALRAGFLALGTQPGDRIAAILPNCPQALVAFLAAASIGAVWTSCSPELGPTAISDRFSQVAPVVLLCVDGYRYGGARYETAKALAELAGRLPSVTTTVVVAYLDGASPPAILPGTRRLTWSELLAGAPTGAPAAHAFEPVAFSHPLWVLYSSGTTGLPKPIVHSHGGILLEHCKALSLHLDLSPGKTFFWYTTTGWMMWNFLIGGLLVGSRVVLYDGSPVHPGPGVLWEMAEEAGVSCFGASAAYIAALMRSGYLPREHHHLPALEMIGSTGSPLSPEEARFASGGANAGALVASLSGGTDVCTAFVGPASVLPCYAGEIQCRMLGAKVEVFDAKAASVVNEVGELVVTAPMPSMPVGLWGDADGSRLEEAYFSTYPGIWRHGDWARITIHGGVVIYGRSDATLNRGGVRVGTAELYRVVEATSGVADSLVVETAAGGITLFVALVGQGKLSRELEAQLLSVVRSELSPRHVPDRVVAVPAVPRTLNGKKCEVPVKRILEGTPVEQAVSAGSLANPEALAVFVEMAEARTARIGAPGPCRDQ
ncbi:MAG: acetoacetate--CoA ligase [Acidimicrobiales bacterium]